MITLTHVVQLVPEEDHAGNTPDHHTSIPIGGRPICNLSFADDIDLMDGGNGELKDLTNRLVIRATAHGMEVSTDKSKNMTDSTKNVSTDIGMDGQKLEEITSFKHLETILCKDSPC